MATTRRTDVNRMLQRLRLKKEELDLRIKKDETAQKLRELKAALKANGGRIR